MAIKAVQLDMIAALTLATPAPDGGAKPRLLDLYCCEGGAGRGYLDAGFDVTGVDILPRPAYPARFIQADAIQYLLDHIHEYDVIHASPPCQFFSISTPSNVRDQYPGPEVFAEIREITDVYGKPLIMENVLRAREHLDLMQRPSCAPCKYWPECEHEFTYERTWREPIMLCGEYFNLKVIRHRYFEVGGIAVPQPTHVRHRGKITDGAYVTVAGHGADNIRGNNQIRVWQEAMGINWIRDRHTLAEAIPPAFTRYLGAYLMAWL